ncbi:MAG TPA: hypothetical protein DCK99_04420, partial [Blastocatellia bacterium]|nr:hypothetical protein [Blastocatellia bacterium]
KATPTVPVAVPELVMFGAPAASALPAAASVRHAAIDIFKAVEGFFLIIIIIIAVLADALSFVKIILIFLRGKTVPVCWIRRWRRPA